jgi:hypothetical protein
MEKENNSHHEHLSVIVLPFNIQNPKNNNNAFDFENYFEHAEQKSIDDFIILLNNIDKKSDNIVDKKHHNFIVEHLSDFKNENETGFLKFISVNQNYFSKKNEILNYNPNINNLKLFDSSFGINFSKRSYIILNDFAQIGYFVFGLEMNSQDQNISKSLSELDFFRYFSKDEKGKLSSKHKMSVIDKEGKTISEICFQDIIEAYFGELIPFIKFQYQKPICLHLFGQQANIENEKIDNCFYNLLRIPAKTQKKLNEKKLNENFLIYPNSESVFGVLNEGSTVLDSSLKGHSELFKKYFPSFILSLNQRELMIQLNRSISSISSKKIESYDEIEIKKLEKLKTRTNIYQLKQVFYSISFYDEINEFYHRLLKVFNIEILLKDNKDCVNEIVFLIDNKRHKDEIALREKEERDRLEKERIEQEKIKKQDETEERRSGIINSILGAIGCLGLFSFLKDLLPFINDSQYQSYYKIFSVLLPIVIMVFILFFLNNSKKNNE